MIKMSVSVETSNGTASYAVTPRVQVEFERQFKLPLIKAFTDDPSLEHLYWLGWRSVKAAGEQVPAFDEWLDTVEAVTPEGGDDVPLGQPSS